MKSFLIIIAGLSVIQGLTYGRAAIRRSAVEPVDRLRAPRSPQVDEELDPSIEDQLAVESLSQPVRQTIQVVAIDPRYHEAKSRKSLDQDIAVEDDGDDDYSAAASLDVYVGGGRRNARQAAPATGKAYNIDDGLVETVALDAVKIRPHGKLGALIKPKAGGKNGAGVIGSRAVFEDSYGLPGAYLRRKRMSEDFIPFSEYDARRVKTLKIEQNDFLALPIRLRALETIEDQLRGREKRKFPEGEDIPAES